MSERANKIDRLIEGLQIIKKYDADPEFAVSHDILIGPPLKVNEADGNRLDELGWFVSTEFEMCWSIFM